MPDTVLASIIAVSGTVVVAVVGVLTQLGITRAVIRSERERIAAQVRADTVASERARRNELLINGVSEILEIADPEINAIVDYPRVVRAIHRMQLLLDANESLEARLNGALNGLGIQLDGLRTERFTDGQSRMAAVSAVLAAHSNVSDCARAVIRSLPPAT